MTTLHGTTSYGTYIELDDAKSWIGVAADDFEFPDSTLQLIIDGACDMVQRYLNRPVAPTEFTRIFDGSSGLQGSWIMLPYYPVVEVLSVIEYQGNNPVTLTEVTPSSGGDGFRVQYPEGRLNRVLGGVWQRPWFPSEMGVFVTWIAGYDPIPSSIRMATLDLVKYWWVQSQAFGITGTVNPYGAEGVGSAMFAGMPYRIEDMLEPFVAVAMG